MRAQGPGQAPDTGNLRVEKDLVFGKGGGKDLTLDVYRPPAGVTSKRTAIVHLSGGGFFVGNCSASIRTASSSPATPQAECCR